MMRRVFPLMLLLLVPLSGCGAQRHAAEAALVGVEAHYERLRGQMAMIAPDQARSIEAMIALAKGTLERGDAKEALRLATDLDTRLRDVSERLPAMHAELQSAWKSLSASLPGTLARLRHELRPANRPPPGQARVAFESSRSSLSDLTSQWAEAQADMDGGRLAEAVAKAEAVRAGALDLANDTHQGS